MSGAIDGAADGAASAANRRAEVRTPLGAPATLYLPGKIVRGRTRDISAGGARLAVPADAGLGPGDGGRVRISLPDLDVVGQFEVVRTIPVAVATELEIAGRFLTMREEQRVVLRRLCQQIVRLVALDGADEDPDAPSLHRVARSMAVRLERAIR